MNAIWEIQNFDCNFLAYLDRVDYLQTIFEQQKIWCLQGGGKMQILILINWSVFLTEAN